MQVGKLLAHTGGALPPGVSPVGHLSGGGSTYERVFGLCAGFIPAALGSLTHPYGFSGELLLHLQSQTSNKRLTSKSWSAPCEAG